MKYLIFFSLLVFTKSHFGQSQKLIIDCGIKKDYRKSTFKKYGRLSTFNFNGTYYNNKSLLCYIGDSTKKVTGYVGDWNSMEYFRRGRTAGRLMFYDKCATRIKEVNLFSPWRNNGKGVHIEYYEDGKRKKRVVTQNYKADKIITWDENGKKTKEKIKRTGRQY
jgi:hypothetical protein